MKQKINIVIMDVLLTWLPIVVVVGVCAYVLIPWESVLDSSNDFWTLINNESVIIAIVFISYSIVIAKNNYDLNHTIIKKMEEIKIVNADDLFCVRSELESLEEILNEAQSISFSGGHLGTLIQAHADELNNFLVNGHEARFILPNPLNDFVVTQYAEKLMVGTTKEAFQQNVILSLSSIKRYMSEGKKIDVRLYNFLPAFGLQIIKKGKKAK